MNKTREGRENENKVTESECRVDGDGVELLPRRCVCECNIKKCVQHEH